MTDPCQMVAAMLMALGVLVAITGGRPRPPARWNGRWLGAPQNVPSSLSVGGPLLGNGDAGLTWGAVDGLSTMYVGKTDFWFLRLV